MPDTSLNVPLAAPLSALLDVLGAVYDFVAAHIQPAPAHIVRGWQNRAALPDASEYVVLTLINAARRGTNVHEWQGTDGGFSVNARMLTLYDVQADFCGLDEARVAQQAALLAMLGRDAEAVRFFRERGLSCLYADDPRSLPFADDLDQWNVRYSVTLHLAAWSDATMPHDAFTKVTLNLENVDAHHPVRATA